MEIGPSCGHNQRNRALSEAARPILWGFFSRLRAGKAVATCDGRHRLQPAFGIPCARANTFGGQTAHAEGPWSANSPTGALAAMAWLVVTAMLTLIAAFIAVALATLTWIRDRLAEPGEPLNDYSSRTGG